MQITEERTTAGVIIRAVGDDRKVLAERHVLTGRKCYRRRLTAARRDVTQEALGREAVIWKPKLREPI